MRKMLALTLAAATTLAAGAVFAQANRGGWAPAMTRDAVEARSAEAFGRMDANDDGLLNQADRAAHEQAVFDRIDADDNGAVSFAEFSALRDDRREERAERPGPSLPEMARAADADRDGAITEAEFQSAALARFDSVDTDRDGAVSSDERRALMRDRFGGRSPKAG